MKTMANARSPVSVQHLLFEPRSRWRRQGPPVSLHVGVSPVHGRQEAALGWRWGAGARHVRGRTCRPRRRYTGACIGANKRIEAGRRACPDCSLLTVRGPDEAGPGEIFVRAGEYGGLKGAGGRGGPPAAPPVLFPPRARHMTEVGAADDPMEVHDA